MSDNQFFVIFLNFWRQMQGKYLGEANISSFHNLYSSFTVTLPFTSLGMRTY